jgi:hypothetical protein
MEDARNIIAQNKANKARYAWKEENYEDDEKEMGALCFTRRVRRTRVPKGFKLPHDQQKYDGSQEPMAIILSSSSANTGRNKSDSNAKFTTPHHRCSTVLVKHPTQRVHQELGRIGKSIRKKFSFDIQTSSINRRSQILYAGKGRNSMIIYPAVEYNKKTPQKTSPTSGQ